MDGFKRGEQVHTEKELEEQPESTEETTVEEPKEETVVEETTEQPTKEAKEGLLSESEVMGDTPKYSGEDPNAAPSLEVELPEELKGKEIDINGDVFDEQLHVVDMFGKPKLNKDKSFKKRRGRKAKSTTANLEEGEKPLTRKEANGAARGYYAAFKKSGSIFMGQDFSKSDKETDEYMITLFENVCMKHNSTGLSPEQMLMLGMGEYTLTKYDEPSCKRYLIDKLMGIKNFFSKKKKEEQVEGGES